MFTPFTDLDAAIRALRGEYPMYTKDLAQVIALTPNLHPVLHTLAALQSERTDLIDARIVSSPDLQAALWQFIGTDEEPLRKHEGHRILSLLAEAAPAGCWNAYATALIDAVNNNRCSAGVAAALIGPCNESARLLRIPADIAFAIRRWGQSFPDAPTAWMDTLSAEEQDRLLAAAQRFPAAIACLPWLPPDRTYQRRFDGDAIRMVIDAFVAASPTARAQYANLLQQLVDQTSPMDLNALTRLARAMQADAVWDRVRACIEAFPDDAVEVVKAASWDELPGHVHDAMLNHAKPSDVCMAIAAARGRVMTARITYESAIAFFAALDPHV